jgi:hypothetical protein
VSLVKKDDILGNINFGPESPRLFPTIITLTDQQLKDLVKQAIIEALVEYKRTTE